MNRLLSLSALMLHAGPVLAQASEPSGAMTELESMVETGPGRGEAWDGSGSRSGDVPVSAGRADKARTNTPRSAEPRQPTEAERYRRLQRRCAVPSMAVLGTAGTAAGWALSGGAFWAVVGGITIGSLLGGLLGLLLGLGLPYLIHTISRELRSANPPLGWPRDLRRD